LLALSVTGLVSELARGAFSAEDYARVLIARIAEIEGEVCAFAHFDPDHVIEQARARDEWRQSGRALGALHGVPVAVKDVFDTEDYPTECGSPLLRGRRTRFDAAAVARLRAAGAIILGKTVTAEFAYFHPGPTRNPHDVERTPGGSSSGSAAAVAAGMAPLAIGTQTNGSTIRPASYCGIYGAKPSHGLISRAGALMLSRALDHVGVFARSLSDVALAIDILAGHDAGDADTRPVASPNCLEISLEPVPLPPAFSFVRTKVWDRMTPDATAAFDGLLSRLGEQVQEIELTDVYTSAWDDHRAIMAADMAHRIGALARRGPDSTSATLRDLLAEGAAVPTVRYLEALDRSREYARGLADMFNHCNAILTPAAPGVAPKGEATGDPAFCTLWTLVGFPAVTLPLLQGEDGMPIGVQLVGAPGDDARLLRTANWLIGALQG
jgi:Asp-tRNA(Asn)/Glu-tRNA(Gln) amidotransferase A subunit family amidase